MTFAVEEVATADRLEALAPAWEALWAADPQAGLFQSPGWLLPWRRHLAAGAPLVTLAAWRDGRLAGLLPMFLHAPRDGPRQLTLLGNGVSDTLDLLAAPEADEDALLDAFAGRLSAWDLWDAADLRDTPADGRTARLAARLPGAATIEDEPRPTLALPAPDALEAAWEPKLRRDLRQAERRGDAEGLAIRAADPRSVARDLDRLFELHAARWRGRGETGVLDAPAVQAFHREVAAEAAARGRLRLYTLELGGEAAGAHYGFTVKRRALFYLGGFDARFERLSPGARLTAHALRAAAAEGCVEADFLRGREAYKYRWGAQDRRQSRVAIARRP